MSDRQTDRYRDDTLGGCQIDRQIDTEMDTLGGCQIDRQIDTEMDTLGGQSDRQTDRYRDGYVRWMSDR